MVCVFKRFKTNRVQTVQLLLRFLEAARDGDLETVRQMLKDNPEVDLNNITDALGNSPLTLAVKNDNAEVCFEHPVYCTL